MVAAAAAPPAAAADGVAAAKMGTRPCSAAAAAAVNNASRTRNLNTIEIFLCLLADLFHAILIIQIVGP